MIFCSSYVTLMILHSSTTLAERTEDASKALAEKRELKVRVAQIQKDFEEEQEQTFEMRQDMTRQYKGMQEELLSRVWVLLNIIMLHSALADFMWCWWIEWNVVYCFVCIVVCFLCNQLPIDLIVERVVSVPMPTPQLYSLPHVCTSSNSPSLDR